MARFPFKITWICIISLISCHLVDAAPSISQRSGAAHDVGTFDNPSPTVRPKFRYWLPDASIDVKKLALDFADFSRLGIGGVELLSYYMYGGSFSGTTPPVVDWSTYGFGTPAFNDVLKASLQAAKDNKLVFDFEVGAQSGQGAPAEPGNPGLTYVLNSYQSIIPAGGKFSGLIPGYGNGTLVSVVLANIVDIQTGTGTQTGLTKGPYNFTEYTLEDQSLQDITSKVSSSGHLDITIPRAKSTSLGYIVYASYYHQPLTRSCIGGENPQNFIQNGSFAVDHFSATGAKVTTDFLDKYVLINGAKEMMQDVGKYIWEDSVEVDAISPYWTPGLVNAFQADHGYSIGKYVPLLASGNGNALSNQSTIRFKTTASDAGQSAVADWRSTMTRLYGDYLNHWTTWTHKLGLEMSAQISYNLPLEMLSNIDKVDAPEGETFAFSNSIDAYLQYSGPANLAGKNIISSELGAQFFGCYLYTLPVLLQNAKVAFAGGVTQNVIHGSPYSWNYPNTTWPGFTTFGYLFSDMHQRHQPAWENGYAEAISWLARTQFVLQSGVPKKDVVFWDKQTAQASSLATVYQPQDLLQAGYSYGYLSPNNLKLPYATVRNGILAPDGPGYKALIIRHNDTLTSEGVTRLATLAGQGLPIIAAGGFPSSVLTKTGGTAAQLQANETLKAISLLPNVHVVSDGPVASTLQKIGIVPNVQVASNSTWWTVFRHDADMDYVWVFNSGNASVGSINVQNTGTPYFFDAWTGTKQPVLSYSVKSSRTQISLTLAPNQAMIIGFSKRKLDDVAVPAMHVIEASDSVIGFSYTKSGGLFAKAISPQSSTKPSYVKTSDNVQHSIPAQTIPAHFSLSNWTLIAEHWDPPTDLYDVDTIANEYNTTHTLPSLLPWSSIPALASTSGVGYYSTSFTWSPTSSSSTLGAMIDFGAIVHSISVKINGKQVPVLDLTSAQTDISEFLVKGKNVVEAKVATTLFNVLSPIWSELRTAGNAPLAPAIAYGGTQVEGLVGDVVVTPYAKVKIA